MHFTLYIFLLIFHIHPISAVPQPRNSSPLPLFPRQNVASGNTSTRTEASPTRPVSSSSATPTPQISEDKYSNVSVRLATMPYDQRRCQNDRIFLSGSVLNLTWLAKVRVLFVAVCPLSLPLANIPYATSHSPTTSMKFMLVIDWTTTVLGRLWPRFL